MSNDQAIHLKIGEGADDPEKVVAYLTLPRPKKATPIRVERNVRLRDLVGDYQGPDLYFDFDEDNVLVGVEVLG